MVRGKAIEWCLAFANYLQSAQAQAIARAAAGSGRLPAGVPLPPPTFPNPTRRRSPPPRVSPTVFRQSPVLSRPSEVKHEDFDDAPTAVYHPIPTNDAPGAAHLHPATIRRGTMQGDVRITSKSAG